MVLEMSLASVWRLMPAELVEIASALSELAKRGIIAPARRVGELRDVFK
jgi:hypothetical protein